MHILSPLIVLMFLNSLQHSCSWIRPPFLYLPCCQVFYPGGAVGEMIVKECLFTILDRG